MDYAVHKPCCVIDVFISLYQRLSLILLLFYKRCYDVLSGIYGSTVPTCSYSEIKEMTIDIPSSVVFVLCLYLAEIVR